ncbi:sensor histidine kinase [Kocuria palustris]|uniref:sensor histidine kinase n=1 Tax=Kocuria palustris TaxID=71999 RepID=UPI0021A5D9E8|nr:sensor histidine kinase [Kocuria palustris]MCT1833293.1 sensor histidine kinase [Kocuria palustris]MDH5150861.1 sensor histidine kinase [Kocuria palustris]
MNEITPREDRSEAAQSAGAEESSRSNWFQQHPRVVDLVVVLAIFTYNLPIQIGSVPDHLWPGTGIVLSVGLCAPYLLRRRYPFGVFACIQIVAIIQVALSVELLVADVMLLLTVYNLAVRARWYISVISAAVLIAWLLVAVVPTMARDHLSVGDVGVLVAVVAWAWTWGRLVQTRRRYIGSLRERAVQLEREKKTESAIAASTERTRVAREIHDIVSHSLSVVIVMSDGAASKIDADPDQAKTAMLTVRDTGRAAMADMRRMLGVLRDDEPGSHAPQPGIAQLDRLIKDSVAAGLPVAFSVEGEPGRIPASVDLAVFRIMQEALTNVRRHAGPEVSRVDVRLRHREDAIEVSITDDGKGPAEDDEERTGHGIVGMQERVTAHGGTLHTGARPGGGFEVVAIVPREAQS